MKRTTVFHPVFGNAVDVDSKQVDQWVDQGWRKTPPNSSSAAATAAEKSGDDKEGK